MENNLSYSELKQHIDELTRENNELKTLLSALPAEGDHQIGHEEKQDYAFEDLFDVNEIQKIQDSFAKATGVASIITRPDGTPITRQSNFCRLCSKIIRKTELGLKNCLQSDAILGRYNPNGPIIAPCHSGGLWDGGASISIGSTHLANWLIGQVRNEELDEDEMLNYAKVIGADEEEFKSALAEVTYMSIDQFEHVGKTLFLMANQLSEIAFQNVEQQHYIEKLEVEEKKRIRLEKQLRQAQKLEAIGRLAGGVAHDFNNILSVINGYTELILQKMTPEDPWRAKIELIHGAGERASRLTQQLVAFGRKQIIQPSLIHLGKELSDINQILIRLLGEDIKVSIQQDDSLWPIMIDRSQLEQVIINLAVNARDAMPAGGHLLFEARNLHLTEPAAYERAGYAMMAGDYIKLSVTDTGCGMPEEIQEKIFEPFFSTKGPQRGNGLGLAMVYGIIKQNNSYINVYSEEGKGSTFTFYFPKSNELDDQLTNASQMMNAAPIEKGHETILLVEDEQPVREMCFTILSQIGYTVIEAANGKVALQVASSHDETIDLLLTDVVMPELNGPETAKELQQEYPDLRVLFMSGYTENAIIHHGVLEKNINFIQKPVTPNALAAAVHNALHKH